MVASKVLVAKRALVKLLLALAAAYSLVLNVNRDTSDADVLKAYRRVALKVHPDKGGGVADMQKLTDARATWDQARTSAKQNGGKGGRPEQEQDDRQHTNGEAQSAEERGTELADPDEARKQFRISATAVLLTYHGFRNLAQWRRFVKHVKTNQKTWKVKNWCATMEATKKGGLHVHIMLQFTGVIDRNSRYFTFEGLAPRADPCDLLGEGFCRNKMQQSINRAMFYCFADKEGTQRDAKGEPCAAGNYWPAWVHDAASTYAVPGRWPENLWKARKLSHETYDNYLFLCRDGVLTRKRNLEAVREREEGQEEEEEMAAVVKRVRAAFPGPWPKVPEAEAWLPVFETERDRYPILIVVGPSFTGKTEWAKSLFKAPLEVKMGENDVFPETMRKFSRKTHDAIVLDDIRDFSFLVRHQEKIQGKYDFKVEFATTPGGQCSYSRWLWRVPIVVTANLTTANRDLLDTNDFLGNPKNRVVVNFPPPQPSA